MYEFDCAVMIDGGSGFVCSEHIRILDTPTTGEDDSLARNGYFIRVIDASEEHIIVNRLDTSSSYNGSVSFWLSH